MNYQKINSLVNKKSFNQAIKIALSELRKTKDRESVSIINLILGNIYDRCGVLETNKQKRRRLFKSALSSYKESLSFHNFFALQGIGTVYLHAGDPRKGLGYYRKAQQKDYSKKFLSASYISLGNAWRKISKKEKSKRLINLAERYYKKALRLGKGDAEKTIALINLALLYSNDAVNPEKAVNYARMALKKIGEEQKTKDNYAIADMRSLMVKILEKFT